MFQHSGNTLTEDGFKNPAWRGLRYSGTLQILRKFIKTLGQRRRCDRY
jgi:hypothetical protein